MRPSDGLGTHRLGSLGWAHSALPGAKVSVGYTQLYNETFSDLLCPRRHGSNSPQRRLLPIARHPHARADDACAQEHE